MVIGLWSWLTATHTNPDGCAASAADGAANGDADTDADGAGHDECGDDGAPFPRLEFASSTLARFGILLNGRLVWQEAVVAPPTRVDREQPSACSGRMELLTASGTISDRLGPIVSNIGDSGTRNEKLSQYAPNLECEWLIRPAEPTRLTLTFERFFLEADYDFLKVYTGSTAKSDRLVISLTGGVPPEPIEVSGTELLLVLTTDASGSNDGFRMRYSTDSVTTPRDMCNSERDDVHVLSDTTGVVTDGDGRYMPNMHCRWLIKPGRPRIPFSFFFWGGFQS